MQATPEEGLDQVRKESLGQVRRGGGGILRQIHLPADKVRRLLPGSRNRDIWRLLTVQVQYLYLRETLTMISILIWDIVALVHPLHRDTDHIPEAFPYTEGFYKWVQIRLDVID